MGKGIEQYPSPFQSIPQSFWWCIVTLATVGYGDMYPYTDIGKTVGVLTMLVGLIMLALPLSIIGTNFIEERNIMVEENKRRDKEAAEDEKRRLGQTLESDEVQVSVRKDLRELLAKADQLYESTGTMVSKLTACQQLLNNMRRTMASHLHHNRPLLVNQARPQAQAQELVPRYPWRSRRMPLQ